MLEPYEGKLSRADLRGGWRGNPPSLPDNYRTRYGEIDLILRDGRCLVFVEVKLRRGTAFGDPAEAVTPRKQQTIRAIAEQYIAEREPDFEEARFDVIGILAPGGSAPSLRHISNAF